MDLRVVAIAKIRPWSKNPRGIMEEDYRRLKEEIQELGVYKPLICCVENNKFITLGGNMRLRALRELGYESVDISVVKAPSEELKIKYSLSDNDRAGFYLEQELAELIQPHIEKIDLQRYKVDLGSAVTLKNVVEFFGPDKLLEDEEEDSSTPGGKEGIGEGQGDYILFTFESEERAEKIRELLDVNKNQKVLKGKILIALLKKVGGLNL